MAVLFPGTDDGIRERDVPVPVPFLMDRRNEPVLAFWEIPVMDAAVLSPHIHAYCFRPAYFPLHSIVPVP